MRIIYVAGPYRNECEFQVTKNIAHAWEISRKLWNAGWAVICPHSNSAFMGLKYKVVIAGDLEIISRCDAILMLYGWNDSVGAQKERNHAIIKGISIFYEANGVIPLPGDIE